MLAKQSPSRLYVFDMLVDTRGQRLTDKPLIERRKKLESFAERYLDAKGQIRLSPATYSEKVAREWLGSPGMDGVIAKRLEARYASGERTGMVKVKPQRTADCVVGGFRWAENKQSGVGSLLLGLYDDEGRLHHVGVSSSFSAGTPNTWARSARTGRASRRSMGVWAAYRLFSQMMRSGTRWSAARLNTS